MSSVSATQPSLLGSSVDVDTSEAASLCMCVPAEPWNCPWLSRVSGYNALAPPCVQLFLYLAGRRVISNPGRGDCWFHASETFTYMTPAACRSFVASDARSRQCVGDLVANEIQVMGTPTSSEHICIAMKALRQEYPHGLLVLNAPMCAGVHFTARDGLRSMRLPEAFDLLSLHPALPTMLFLRDGLPNTIGHFVACVLTSPLRPPSGPQLPSHVRYCCNFTHAWDMLGGVGAIASALPERPRRRLRSKSTDLSLASTQALDLTDIGSGLHGCSETASHDIHTSHIASPEAPRGVFQNPRNKTCYLGAVLQALLNTHTFRIFCLDHEPGEACVHPCVKCLLLAAAQGTTRSSHKHCLESWGEYLTERGLDFTRQNDALEVLQILGNDATLGPKLSQFLAASGTRQYHVQYPCGHVPDESMTETFRDIVVELRPCSSHTLLHAVMNADGNAASHVTAGCPCGEASKSTVSYGFVDAQDLLVVGISRQVIVMGSDVDGKPTVERIMKSDEVVQPDMFLEVGSSTYALRSIVQHLGEDCRTGHYITHIHVGGHGYWTYDDGKQPTFRKSLHRSAFSASRLYIYEKRSGHDALTMTYSVQHSELPQPMACEQFTSKTTSPLNAAADSAAITHRDELHQVHCDAPQHDTRLPADPRVVPGADVFMDKYHGQARVHRDVQELLDAYVKGESCSDFLASLPLFINDTNKPQTFGDVTTSLDVALASMVHDEVNSAAALEVRPYVADSLLYPFYVLMEATSKALAIPPLFLVDNVTALMHSVLHKHTYAKVGRWKSKSRYWWVGVANVGEGKSQGMKALTDDMVAALSKHSAFAAGHSHDRFHFQQSGTTAAAIDKLRTCCGYLCIYCSDAGRCLSKPAAAGTPADPHKHVDLEYFLDAAHGDEFNHSNKIDRQKVLAKRVKSQEAPAEPPESLHIDPTNIHILFLIQNLFFQTWFAQIAEKHPVGIPQRCLFSFGGKVCHNGTYRACFVLQLLSNESFVFI